MASDPRPNPQYGHPDVTEEFDNASHNFPPIATVGIALLIVAIVIGAAALLWKKPQSSSGFLTDVFGAQVPNQATVLCTTQFTIQNKTKQPIVIRGISASLATSDGKTLEDTAASSGDYPRYFAALPELKNHTLDPVRPDMQIAPGASLTGSAIFAFSMTKQDFDARKSITVTVDLYDHNPLKLQK